MSQDLPPDHISKKRVRFDLPGMNEVRVKRGIQYAERDGASLTLDAYYQDSSSAAGRPAVILVTGYADAGAQRFFGCRFKEMGAFVSWAELIAASGMIAITYENRTPSDVSAVFDHVDAHRSALGIGSQRFGVWACSGHGPNALALVADRPDGIGCAALLYAYTLDRPGGAHVAGGAKMFGFVTSARTIDSMPTNVPLLLVRAGRDEMPGLNAACDAFAADALERNLPITLVNHPTAPHAFDLSDDSAASRLVIRQTLDFLAGHLLTARDV